MFSSVGVRVSIMNSSVGVRVSIMNSSVGVRVSIINSNVDYEFERFQNVSSDFGK